MASKSIMKIDYKALFHQERRKNEYLTSVINVYKNNHNVGEKDEVLLLLKLLYLNKNKKFEKLTEIFGDEASEGIEIIDQDTRTEVHKYQDIKKCKGSSKADACIKMKKSSSMYNASIKSKNGANPAILNHTPRSAKIFNNGGKLECEIPNIDVLVDEYKEKRKSGIIGEDVSIMTLNHMKTPEIYESVKNMLSYFAFDGTGKGDSNNQANSILYVDNDNISFVKCTNINEKHAYVEAILDRCVISLRDKGMPKILNDICTPWVFNEHKSNGVIKQKGSLHIRIK